VEGTLGYRGCAGTVEHPSPRVPSCTPRLRVPQGTLGGEDRRVPSGQGTLGNPDESTGKYPPAQGTLGYVGSVVPSGTVLVRYSGCTPLWRYPRLFYRWKCPRAPQPGCSRLPPNEKVPESTLYPRYHRVPSLRGVRWYPGYRTACMHLHLRVWHRPIATTYTF
jgi:hypothetical protein